MSDIDTLISQLKKKREQAQLAKARSQAAEETYTKQYEDALDELRNKFRLDNLDDVHAKLVELQATLDDRLKEATAILDKINL